MFSIVSEPQQIRDLRDSWTDLLLASARPSVFLSWEWVTTWMAQYGSHATPCVVLVQREPRGELLGLASLYRTRARAPLALRTVRFMGTGVGADHLAFLSRRGHEAEVTRSVTEHLAGLSDWDMLEFPRLEATFAAGLTGALERLGRTPAAHTLSIADRCPYLPLPATWEDYLTRLGSHRRSELGRQRRRLEKHGDVRIRRVEQAGDLPAAWDALVRLHQGRRESIGERSAFTTPASRRFHEAFARLALDRGWLRFYLMTIGDRPVAAEYCFSVGGCVTDFQGGFDVELSRYGVGTLLVAHAIEQAIVEGSVEFDFLRGAEQYKQQRWAAEVREDMSLVVWRRRLRVETILAARRWGRGVRGRLIRPGRLLLGACSAL